MKTTQELITELNITDETDKTEVKLISGNDVGKSFYETVSAFSNEPELDGGTILLGVEREDALFPIYTVAGDE